MSKQDNKTKEPVGRSRYPQGKLMRSLMPFLHVLKGTAFKLAVALAARMQKQGTEYVCWPGYKQLFIDIGISNRKAMATAIKRLRELGIIRTRRRQNNSQIYTWGLEVDQRGTLITNKEKREENTISNASVTEPARPSWSRLYASTSNSPNR